MSQNYSRVEGQSSPPPEYASADNERDRLVEAFESDSDEEDSDNVLDDDWEDDRNINQRGGRSLNPFARSGQRYETVGNNNDNNNGSSSGEIVFDSEGSTSTSNLPPPQPSASHAIQPSANNANNTNTNRSWFANWRLNRNSNNRQNDGVFANLTAKPGSGQEKPSDDVPPTYEEAAADATPPYWETTIMTPGFGDELFIEGLPVGSPVNFIWNMMVSSAFQFVGFFLTYLLHTSHAAKQGSRAGLGFTLLQCGYYLSPRSGDAGAPTAPPSEFQPSDPNDPNVSAVHGISGSFSTGHDATAAAAAADAATQSSSSSDDQGSGWVSMFLLIVGSAIIIKSVLDYFQARRMELAILAPATETPATNTNTEGEGGESQSQSRPENIV